MKQLICEMCGSKDLLKQDGVFVCQSCGCRYSVEEARKMMIEGTVDVSGSTVKVDRRDEQQQQIKNYLEICLTSLEASDTASVVEYSDKILEIDPNNYEAWMYRAVSCGWESSLNNMKTGQVITAAKRALQLSPEDRREEIAEKIYMQGYLQILAHVKSVASMYSGVPYTGNVYGRPLAILAKQAEYFHSIMQAWVRLLSEIPYLSPEKMRYEIEHSLDRVSKIDLALYVYARDLYVGANYKEWLKKCLKGRIDKVVEQRREDYWGQHAEEKMALKEERKELESRIAALREEIGNIPGGDERDSIQQRIDLLTQEKSSIGLFKTKERKAVQEKIDAANLELQEIIEKMNAAKQEIEAKIAENQRRIDEIADELTKER